jgi:hypothetical protein
MEDTAPLARRPYREIGRNRRRLLDLAYQRYPEYAYCDPEEFHWRDAAGRADIFDLYYLADSGYLQVTQADAGVHRRPEFFMLTPKGADLIETPGMLAAKLPLRRPAAGKKE